VLIRAQREERISAGRVLSPTNGPDPETPNLQRLRWRLGLLQRLRAEAEPEHIKSAKIHRGSKRRNHAEFKYLVNFHITQLVPNENN
jgi:hypothetical protein